MTGPGDPAPAPAPARAQEAERRWQLALVVGGVLVAGVGAKALLTDLRDEVLDVAIWSLAPVAVHDALLAPLAVAGAWLAARVLPRPAWPAVVGGALASAGLLAVGATVVGRPGAQESVPSLLDRSYGTGLVVALLVVWTVTAALAVVAVVRARRRRTGTATGT